MQELPILKNNSQDVRTMWDKIGVTLSGLCLIHCLVLPVLAAALPWLGGFFEDERVHLIFAAVTVPVALIAFVPAFLRHQSYSLLSLGGTGVLFLLMGSLGHPWLGEWLSHWVTILGGCLLVSAHVLNYRLATQCCPGELCQKHAG